MWSDSVDRTCTAGHQLGRFYDFELLYFERIPDAMCCQVCVRVFASAVAAIVHFGSFPVKTQTSVRAHALCHATPCDNVLVANGLCSAIDLYA